MTTGSGRPEDRDLNRWLDGLAGDAESADPLTESLRQTVLEQQQRYEGEIDDLRLRRGRDKMIEAVRARQATAGNSRRAGPWAIAASIALVATAGLIGYQLQISGPDPVVMELVMSHGDLERPRGNFPEIAIDVGDPLRDGQAMGQRLAEADVPFELRRSPDAGLRLAVSVGSETEIRVLQEVLGEQGGEIDNPGFYVIRIE